MVEQSDQMYGGTCINIACVTKALVYQADLRRDAELLERPVAVVPRDVVGSLWMELDAPAPAEDAVVSLHERCEEAPRVRSQRLDRRGAGVLGRHDADRTRASDLDTDPSPVRTQRGGSGRFPTEHRGVPVDPEAVTDAVASSSSG